MSKWTAAQIKRQIEQFRNWLAANGAQVMEPTNEWEIVRFKTGTGTGVIYAKATGEATLTGPATKAWEAFKGGHSWRAALATKRRQKSAPAIQTLRTRDGCNCFFCLLPVDVEDESVEHLVPLTAGGPDHLANKFLAHRICNNRAGHLSAAEKIALHVKAHMKRLENA